MHYVCPVSYFDYIDEKRKTVDTYFADEWHSYNAYFPWEYELHFFANPANVNGLSESEWLVYQRRIESFNRVHYHG